MKKNYLSIFIPLCLVALALAACGPTTGEVNQYLAADNTVATEIENFDAGSAVVQQGNSSTALSFTGTVPDTMRYTTEQRFSLDFNFEIDPATIPTGIFFYPLSNATNGFTLSPRGTAMPYTTVVEPIGGGGSRVIFTVNLSTATNPSEFFIDAAVLAGINGQKLDGDGDGVLGDDNDDYIDTFVVLPTTSTTPATPTALTTVVVGQPHATMSSSPSAYMAINAVLDLDLYNTDAAHRFQFTLSDTGSSATPNKVSLTGAVQGFVFENGAWVALALPAPTYDAATYTATVTLPTGHPARARSYKLTVDTYAFVESEAVRGYVHRVNYDEDDAGRYVSFYYNFSKPTVSAQQGMTVTIDAADNANYLDFVVAGGDTPIDLATVNAANFKIQLPATTILSSGSAAGTPFFVNFAASDVIIMESSSFDGKDNLVRHFKIRLPTWIQELDTAGTPNVIRISPNVLSVDNAAQNGVGLRSFGDVSGTDGWRIISF